MGNRDYINDLNYVNEWNYGLASDAWNRDKYDDETYYNRQMDKVALMSELGDYSGLKTLGYTDDEIAALTAAWKKENSSGRSSGGSGSGDEEDEENDEEVYAGANTATNGREFQNAWLAAAKLKNEGKSDKEINDKLDEYVLGNYITEAQAIYIAENLV